MEVEKLINFTINLLFYLHGYINSISCPKASEIPVKGQDNNILIRIHYFNIFFNFAGSKGFQRTALKNSFLIC